MLDVLNFHSYPTLLFNVLRNESLLMNFSYGIIVLHDYVVHLLNNIVEFWKTIYMTDKFASYNLRGSALFVYNTALQNANQTLSFKP